MDGLEMSHGSACAPRPQAREERLAVVDFSQSSQLPVEEIFMLLTCRWASHQWSWSTAQQFTDS